MTTGRGPNCVTCHHSHDIQKASINIINEKLCGICHTYDRAREMKAALLRTEQQMNEIDHDLQILKAGLIATQNEEQVLFRTQAEYRTLFHTVDVKLVQAKTGEFSKKLAAISQSVQKGFQKLKFRQDFSIFILLIFIGLGITIFLLVEDRNNWSFPRRISPASGVVRDVGISDCALGKPPALKNSFSFAPRINSGRKRAQETHRR